jgi:hypothetical protein
MDLLTVARLHSLFANYSRLLSPYSLTHLMPYPHQSPITHSLIATHVCQPSTPLFSHHHLFIYSPIHQFTKFTNLPNYQFTHTLGLDSLRTVPVFPFTLFFPREATKSDISKTASQTHVYMYPCTHIHTDKRTKRATDEVLIAVARDSLLFLLSPCPY